MARKILLGPVLLLLSLMATSAITQANTSIPGQPHQAAQPDPSESTEVVRFAAIGDFGSGDENELAVSLLVKSWMPDLIITLGDNNYPAGAASTIDETIGFYYHEFISPYAGSVESEATTNRFFPSLGNHDWETLDAQPYLDYFELPHNERYYDFTWGPVHFFALDSDSNEPDGITSDSIQAGWLRSLLEASTSPWKIVYFHHTPYTSSSRHNPADELRWPFQEWGATAVLAGHNHVYERFMVNDFPYFTNGLGGAIIYDFGDPLPGSAVRYNNFHGAMLVTASRTRITFEFYSIFNYSHPIDTYTIFTDDPDVNDPPLARSDDTETRDNTTLLVDVAANDTDFEGNLDPTSIRVTSDPDNGTATSNGDGTITYISDADFIGRDTFTYEIADSEGLTGTAVVTVTVTSSTFLTFTPTDDTTIYEDSPSLNLGSRDALEVDQEEVKDILLRFEVSGVGTQPIASATLRLFSIDASPSGGIFYSTIDTRWSESTVTWATAPQPVGNSFATLDVVEPNEWYEVDVTSLINGDGPVSIRITSEHTDGADYASKENALQIVPILNINLQR